MSKLTSFGVALGGFIVGGLTVGTPVLLKETELISRSQNRIKQTGISVIDYEKIGRDINKGSERLGKSAKWQRALDSLEAKASLNQALLAMKKGVQRVK